MAAQLIGVHLERGDTKGSTTLGSRWVCERPAWEHASRSCRLVDSLVSPYSRAARLTAGPASQASWSQNRGRTRPTRSPCVTRARSTRVVRAADNADTQWIELDTKATATNPRYVLHYIWADGRLFGPTEDPNDQSRLSAVTPGEPLAFLTAPTLGEFTAARLVASVETAHRNAPDPASGKFTYRIFGSPESIAERGADAAVEFAGTMSP